MTWLHKTFEALQNGELLHELMPIVSFYWDRVFFQEKGIGLVLILTDNAWTEDDQSPLLNYSSQICDEIAYGQRPLVKIM